MKGEAKKGSKSGGVPGRRAQHRDWQPRRVKTRSGRPARKGSSSGKVMPHNLHTSQGSLHAEDLQGYHLSKLSAPAAAARLATL